MKIAMIGLGRMGANMARRLSRGGHSVYGYNRTSSVTEELARTDGILPIFDLADLKDKLDAPRVAWVMMPAGKVTDDFLETLMGIFSPGDILIDGGNSNFNDTIRRAAAIEAKGFRFVDVGTSGGIWGLKEGYSMMIGGNKDAVETLRPIFETLAPGADKGWGYMGPHGSGHFVKMVHNGIEYGMMEAYAEGFEILKARKDFNLDLHQISQVWQYGSVVRSWLLDLIEASLVEDQNLSEIKGWVADSGEGRWTIMEAINEDVPAPIITLSLFRRFESRQDDSYAAKLLAAMRNQFGGHAVKKTGEG
jgi:6-phosphogluconate dehydrogenase